MGLIDSLGTEARANIFCLCRVSNSNGRICSQIKFLYAVFNVLSAFFRLLSIENYCLILRVTRNCILQV
jgi:hypothetical protein